MRKAPPTFAVAGSDWAIEAVVGAGLSESDVEIVVVGSAITLTIGAEVFEGYVAGHRALLISAPQPAMGSSALTVDFSAAVALLVRR